MHGEPAPGKSGFARIWNALFHSFDRFAAAFRHEDAFRLEVLLAKRAKEIGSAAVMLSPISVPVVWLLVLFG